MLAGGSTRRTVLGLVLGALGLFAAFGLPKITGCSGDDYTFKETLSEVKEDFGEDAKVVTIQSTGGGFTYEVVKDTDTITQRRYFVETSEARGPQGQPAQGRTRKKESCDRAAKPAEVAAAKVTLGQIDEGVVDKMFEEVDLDPDAGFASLSGSQWSFYSGERPFDRYKASLDGSRVEQTQSKEDIFGTGGKPPQVPEVQVPTAPAC